MTQPTTTRTSRCPGAQKLKANLLQSAVLINVDSEVDESICMGSAGGHENVLSLPVNVTEVPASEGFAAHRVQVHGCHGGHSGSEIHIGYASAAKVLNRLLLHGFEEMGGFALAHYEAGNAHNAIPSHAEAVVLGPARAMRKLLSAVEGLFATVCQEFLGIEGETDANGRRVTTLRLELTRLPAVPPSAVPSADVRRALGFVALVPHGVLRMSPDMPGLVESSTSMGFVRLRLQHADGPHLMVHTLTRSSHDSALRQYAEECNAWCGLAGARDSGRLSVSPGWTPNVNSKALAAAKTAAQRVFGKPVRVYSVHAGLEVGLLLQKYPHMDAISIGPLIKGAHSPSERLLISSVGRFWEHLKQTIQLITERAQMEAQSQVIRHLSPFEHLPVSCCSIKPRKYPVFRIPPDTSIFPIFPSGYLDTRFFINGPVGKHVAFRKNGENGTCPCPIFHPFAPHFYTIFLHFSFLVEHFHTFSMMYL